MKKIINKIMQWIMAVVVAIAFGIIGCNDNQNQVQTSPPEYQQPTAKPQPKPEANRPVSRENLGVTIAPLDQEKTKPQPQPQTQPVVKNLPPTEAQTLSETLERQKTIRTKTRYYIMQQGDTLWSVSRRFYGSGKYWKRIAKANPGIDIANIKTGQKIVLPY